MSDARERAERAASAFSFPVGTVTYQLARDLLAALDRVEELEEGIASAMTSLATGPAKDGYAYAILAALASAAATEHDPFAGLPPDLLRVLRDPTITIDRDHEIRLADGRTLFEHLEEWRNAPSNTASAAATEQEPT